MRHQPQTLKKRQSIDIEEATPNNERTVSLNNLSLELDTSVDIFIDIDEVINMCALSDDEEKKADNMKPTTSRQRPTKPTTILFVLEKEMSVDYEESCTSELKKKLKMVNIVPNRFFPSKLRTALNRDKHFLYFMTKNTSTMRAKPLTSLLLDKMLSEKALGIDEPFLKEQNTYISHNFLSSKLYLTLPNFTTYTLRNLTF